MRDKYLTEAMGGKKDFACYVEGDPIFDCVMDKGHDETWSSCTHGTENGKRENCAYWKEEFLDGITDFSTWQGFGKLWEWAQEQEWWITFSDPTYGPDCGNGMALMFCIDHAIHPDRFADAVYEFLKGRDGE